MSPSLRVGSGYLLCAIIAVVLASPGFRSPYLFDDYDFLARVQSFQISILAPEPGQLFYRPLSREVYFGILELVSRGNALTGHIGNSLVLTATVLLGAALASRLAGVKAGIVAGLLIATYAHWPVLVGWVCGSQDLFAIALTLTAMHLQLSGRGVAALIALAAAIVSKMHVLLTSGGANPRGGYVGFHNPDRLMVVGRSLPALLNLPLTGYPTNWPTDLNLVLLLSLVLVSAVLWILPRQADRGTSSSKSSPRFSSLEIAVFSILFVAPPLLLTCLMVREWAPYYLCFPAVGLAIGLCRWIATMPYTRAVAVLSLYVVLGVWSRGIELGSGIATERGLAPAAMALPRLEKSFKRVAPSLPSSSIVYVSTMAAGPQSVYVHIHRFQVLRVWYSDHAIQTLRPELRVGAPVPEFLFWIDPSLNVFQIDVRDFSVRSSGGSVNPRDYRSTLTSYAIGLASLGDIGRAVEILLGLSDPGSWDHIIDRRIAATLLLSRGEDAAAIEVVRGTPKLPYETAIENVGVLLTAPSRGTQLERYALRAFGIPPNDVGARHVLVRGLLSLGHYAVAGRLAQQILALNPEDSMATKALERVRAADEQAYQGP